MIVGPFFAQKVDAKIMKNQEIGMKRASGVEPGQGLWYPKQVAHGKAVFDTQEAPKRSDTLKNYDFPTFSKNSRKKNRKSDLPEWPKNHACKAVWPK